MTSSLVSDWPSSPVDSRSAAYAADSGFDSEGTRSSRSLHDLKPASFHRASKALGWDPAALGRAFAMGKVRYAWAQVRARTFALVEARVSCVSLERRKVDEQSWAGRKNAGC